METLALPASLPTLEPVPSIFHNRGGRGSRGREESSPQQQPASHPSAKEPLRVGRPCSPVEARLCGTAVKALVSLPRALLKES